MTDSSAKVTPKRLLRLCADGVPLLTADLPLYLAAVARGAAATKVNYLRDAR